MDVNNLLEVCAVVTLVMSPVVGCGGEAEPIEPKAKLAVSDDVGTTEQAVAYNGNNYLFVSTPKTWEQAQAYCKLSGYNLVTINDASEEAFLNTQESYRGLGNWWIGYNDRAFEGSWTWLNGSSGYTNWDPMQPDNFQGNENCGTDRYTNVDGSGNVFTKDGWNDWDCSKSFPFICEGAPLSQDSRGVFSYSASNTSSATANTQNQSVYLYAGQIFTVGTCGLPGAKGDGDTYLRINNPSGQEIASNDDAGSPCGTLSNISIVIPTTGTYVMRAGCYGKDSCGGTVSYNY